MLFLAFTLNATTLSAGDKLRLDIRPGQATESLKSFVEQTGLQLIYPSDQLSETRTIGIRGKYLPKNALKRMLSGTSFEIVHDQDSGAFAIVPKTNNPQKKKAPHLQERTPPPEENKDLNPSSKKRLINKTIATIFGPPSESSQTTSTERAETDYFELSPFEITASDQSGYRATSTLAGTRIRTDLKDLAASISVVTSQFLEDTGAVDNQSLLQYTINTEVGGLYGNFSGLSNNQGVEESAMLIAPSSNTRIRGLDSADNTQNYFQSNIPWDGYNVGRVDLQRGPNSILFGVGSPAGIINTSLITPMFENETKLENRLGSNGSVRNTIDYNRELIEDVLAIRIAALDDRKKFQQKPAFEDAQRVFGSIVYKPNWFGDKSRTTLRGNMEFGDIDANRPRMLPPMDQITPFFFTDGINRQTWAPAWVWQERVFVDPATYSPEGGNDKVQPWMSTSMGNAYDGNSVILEIDNEGGERLELAATDANVFGAIDRNGEIDNGIGAFPFTRRVGINGLNAYSKAAEVLDPTSYPSAAKNFYKDQVLSDPTIFDFYNNLIDGENKREWSDWNSLNLSIEQSFLDNRIGLEFVYDYQDYTQGAEALFGWVTSIGVDINSHTSRLPTAYDLDETGHLDPASVREGEINPNAGRAYISGEAQGNARQEEIERKNLRLTAYGELNGYDFFDENSFLANSIGRNIFTTLFSRNERNDFVTNWSSFAMPIEYSLQNNNSTDPILDQSARGVGYTVYLTNDLRDRSSAAGLNIERIGHRIDFPDTASVRYFDSTWNSSEDPGAPYSIPLDGFQSTQSENPENYIGWIENEFDILSSSNPLEKPLLYTAADKRTEVLQSEALTWQGYLFGGKIVPTYGWRRDTIETWGATGKTDEQTKAASINFANDKSQGSTLTSDGQTTTWGVVAHSPKFINDKLPAGTDFSLFYNKSKNFKAENRVGFDTKPLPNPKGESEDFGMVLRTLEDKLMLKVTWYETTLSDANIPGGNALAGGTWFLHGIEAWGTALALKHELYWLGELPGQAWRSNYGLNDEGNWGVEGWENAPFSEEALNHPSNVLQRAAVADWYATMPPQEFFDGYGLPIDRNKAQGTIEDRRTMIDNGNWGPWSAIGTIQPTGGGKVQGLEPVGTIDQISKGVEFELIAQPTQNWSISINAAKTDSKRTDLGESFANFIESTKERLDGPAGDLRLWWGGDRTIRENYDAIVYQAYLFQLDANGSAASEIRPWGVNLISNYKFESGAIKGTKLGFAYRWQDNVILGYQLDDTQSKLDINRPIKGGAEGAFDAWVGYEKNLSEQINWRIQLNLKGIGKDDRLIPVSVNPDGSPATQRIAGGMSWALTNSFAF